MLRNILPSGYQENTGNKREKSPAKMNLLVNLVCNLPSMIGSSNSSGSISSFSLGRSISVWFIGLLLISSSLGFADAGTLMNGNRMKRSFFEIGCKGVFSASIFAELDRVCKDCYDLFREPQLHSLCRSDCFTSDFFKGCMDVLLYTEEKVVENFKNMVKQVHGADPPME